VAWSVRHRRPRRSLVKVVEASDPVRRHNGRTPAAGACGSLQPCLETRRKRRHPSMRVAYFHAGSAIAHAVELQRAYVRGQRPDRATTWHRGPITSKSDVMHWTDYFGELPHARLERPAAHLMNRFPQNASARGAPA